MTDRAELDHRLAKFLQWTAPERTAEELLADVKRQEARMLADIRRSDERSKRDLQELFDGVQRWSAKPRKRSARRVQTAVTRCLTALWR